VAQVAIDVGVVLRRHAIAQLLVEDGEQDRVDLVHGPQPVHVAQPSAVQEVEGRQLLDALDHLLARAEQRVVRLVLGVVGLLLPIRPDREREVCAVVVDVLHARFELLLVVREGPEVLHDVESLGGLLHVARSLQYTVDELPDLGQSADVLLAVEQRVEQLANVHAGVGPPLGLDVYALGGAHRLAASGPTRDHEAEFAPVAHHVIAAAPAAVGRVVDIRGIGRRILPRPAEQRRDAEAAVPLHASFQALGNGHRLLAGDPGAVHLLEHFFGDYVVGALRGPPVALAEVEVRLPGQGHPLADVAGLVLARIDTEGLRERRLLGGDVGHLDAGEEGATRTGLECGPLQRAGLLVRIGDLRERREDQRRPRHELPLLPLLEFLVLHRQEREPGVRFALARIAAVARQVGHVAGRCLLHRLLLIDRLGISQPLEDVFAGYGRVIAGYRQHRRAQKVFVDAAAWARRLSRCGSRRAC
jgi:hypothetical protein